MNSQDWRPWNTSKQGYLPYHEKTKTGSKRKSASASHMIENVVGPAPAKKIVSDLPDPLDAIRLPEPKIPLAQRSKNGPERTVWPTVSLCNNEAAGKNSNEFVKAHSREAAPMNNSNSAPNRIDPPPQTPLLPTVSNYQINYSMENAKQYPHNIFDFSIHSICGDYVEDFCINQNINHVTNQSKKQMMAYNQYSNGSQFASLEEDPTRNWTNDLCFPYMSHDQHSYEYQYPSTSANTPLEHSNYDYSYKSHSSHNISQILNQAHS